MCTKANKLFQSCIQFRHGQKCSFCQKRTALTLLCKEGEESARVGELFVAGCQNENKVQQKKNRALPRTSHISCNQTQSTAEESRALEFQRPLGSCSALCHVMNKPRNLPSRRETCIEQDWEPDHGLKREKAPALRRKEGRSVLSGSVYFPCEERGGAEQGEERREGSYIDLTKPARSVLCRDLSLNPAPAAHHYSETIYCLTQNTLEQMTWTG